MVWKLKCDCEERYGIDINSSKTFEEIRTFFSEQVKKGLFLEIDPVEPYYIGYSELQKKNIKWYATKWYKCNNCGCLWEFQYPDFPAKGFVRKFKDGKYSVQDLSK